MIVIATGFILLSRLSRNAWVGVLANVTKILLKTMLNTIQSIYILQTETKEVKEFKQFHFMSWPDCGVPESPSSMLNFRNKVMEPDPNIPDGPILVHCRFVCLDKIHNFQAYFNFFTVLPDTHSPYGKILDLSKAKIFIDSKFNVADIVEFVFYKV